MHLMKDTKENKVLQHSFENKQVILAQGVGKIFKWLDTIFFVDYKKSQVRSVKT